VAIDGYDTREGGRQDETDARFVVTRSARRAPPNATTGGSTKSIIGEDEISKDV